MVGEKEAEKFDESIIQSLDNTDNTGVSNPLSTMISSMNPNWDSDQDSNEAFKTAVKVAETLLRSKIESMRSMDKASQIVKEDLEESNGKIVILKRFAPWGDVLIPSTAIFVVYLSNRGQYNVQVISAEFGNAKTKKDLPASWLEPANKPKGCLFLHNGLFIAAFDTLINVVDAAMDALNK